MYLSQFLTIALVHLLAVASPGPDFAIVVRQSVRYDTRSALWTSLGLGLGILIHVCYCLLGIGLIISQSIIVFTVIKIACALYLFYIGVKSLKAQPQGGALIIDGDQENQPTTRQAIVTGFLTNGLNPKATLFFLSLFTVVIDHSTPLIIQAGYGLYMAVATGVWFSLLSLFLGQGAIRTNLLKVGHWIERATGVVLILLGIKLIATTQE